jgi:hypothetical protein
MKRILKTILVSLAFSLLAVGASAQPKKKPDCTAKHDPIKVPVDCPDDKLLAKEGIKACDENGCGTVDKLLNQHKNTDKGNPNSFVNMAFSELAAIPKCVQGYDGIGDPRDVLKNAGEGKMVRTVAWALDSRPQHSRKDKEGNFPRGESCNCGFTGIDEIDGGPKNTDVHIVLVKTPDNTESESQTAEYTPRVRVKLKEAFDGGTLKDLISKNDGNLLVRVTGLLMYDSEHAFENPLTRQSNWEIHPVFRLEYCPSKKCKEDSTSGWVDLSNK